MKYGRDKIGHFVAGTFVCAAVLGACSAPGGPDSIKEPQFPHPAPTPISTDGGVVMNSAPLTCAPIHSSQDLPARTTLTSGMSLGSSGTVVFTSELFQSFKVLCGQCHVDSNLGMFQLDVNSFPASVDMVLERIQTTDMTKIMPPQAPPGTPYASRSATDPIVQFVGLLNTWISKGRPPLQFTIDNGSGGDTGMADYSMTPQLGDALTNIGSCVPAGTIGQNTQTMDALDAFWAQATELPDTIAETDLISLDSMTLAGYGVISYAPTYPLWSDNSGKMRYVRVPRGQAITFDKATQSFKLPENTRFYKTFLKKIIDGQGNETWRKIETRLIVARSDTDPLPGQPGDTVQNALYGTYIWNDDESNAVLLKDPLRNETPFRDRVIRYFTDEGKAQEIVDKAPADLEGALASVPGLVRHYAVPGSARCVACHMGSPSADFVLGFTPLQVNRRPGSLGTAGLFEEATGDELNQLQRLIDYGVIKGISSPADLLPLEQSQGTRKPRNDYELLAQGYLLGNCSHCHNPRGFPTKKAPELKDVLNFLPSADGGIFEFPLTRTSPVRKRGVNQDVDIPYVTPSLYDYPWIPGSFQQKGIDCNPANNRFSLCHSPVWQHLYIKAPWRSLIYRNVDTPFDYVEDHTIFPHMPMNSAGYDCRAPHIVGDWMTSIPAVLKDPKKTDKVFYLAVALKETPNVKGFLVGDGSPGLPYSQDPQPYVEVGRDDPGYADAVAAADARRAEYHVGHRYDFCPDTTDILDPFITNLVDMNEAVEEDRVEVLDPMNPGMTLWPDIGVPMRPHWVVTDTTDTPGDWNPRRPDWATSLLEGKVGDTGPIGPDDLRVLTDVIDALQTVKLTPDVKALFSQKLPMGLWKTDQKMCNFAGIPTAGSYQGDSRPQWLDGVAAQASAPVYEQTYGGEVFNTICFNCHGSQADSKGLLADEIALMTGGDARVANFRDGLFGPRATPGTARLPIFIDPAGKLSTDDLASRYVAWMALGGTLKHLPGELLNLVSNTRVYGRLRNTGRLPPEGTPDMLRLGLSTCLHLLASDVNAPAIALTDNTTSAFTTKRIPWDAFTGLIQENGDAEMWMRLCSLNNRPVVRVFRVPWTKDTKDEDFRIVGENLYWGDGDASGPSYPANAPVMNHRFKVVTGLNGDNWFPMCVTEPAKGSPEHDLADQFLDAHRMGGAGGDKIPYCPAQLFAQNADGSNKFQLAVATEPKTIYLDAEKWAARGAINAGQAVFVYLDQLARGQQTVLPPYDQCEALGSMGATQ
jgi:mono/diheme cytochrome c family protein